MSDDSALTVLDRANGEEVAALAGRLEMDVFAGHIARISAYFYNAPAMIERNNHGHTVLQCLKGGKVKLLTGTDGKPGWLTNEKSKTLVYDTAAELFRDGETILHTLKTYAQLQSIEGATQRAPEGEMDDAAVAYVLALMALTRNTNVSTPPFAIDRGCWSPYRPY